MEELAFSFAAYYGWPKASHLNQVIGEQQQRVLHEWATEAAESRTVALLIGGGTPPHPGGDHQHIYPATGQPMPFVPLAVQWRLTRLSPQVGRSAPGRRYQWTVAATC